MCMHVCRGCWSVESICLLCVQLEGEGVWAGSACDEERKVCPQLLKCKSFGRVKALSTQPWRLDPGHSDRLSQPAVSVPSQKDLSICFQLGRLLFSEQKFGSQTILANILS